MFWDVETWEERKKREVERGEVVVGEVGLARLLAFWFTARV